MRNLFQLFVRFGGFFLFVVLEGLCFYLVVQYNTKQNQIFFSSANTLVGASYNRYDNFLDYLGLKREIADLMEENARLRRQVETLTATDPGLPPDTLLADSLKARYDFLPARVINNSISRNNNTLTLDRGRRHGLEPHMGVISDNGIVGIVRHVSEHYASVMSILHRQARISAAIKDTGYFGSLVWENNDPVIMYLEAIPKHAVLEKGQPVVTSGFSNFFPPGIPVGEIEEAQLDPGSNFYRVKVRLSADLAKLQHVYAVVDHKRDELTALEQKGADE